MARDPHQSTPESTEPTELSDPNSGTTLDMFTFFPKLPTELRMEIWRLAISHRRFIKVVYPYNRARDMFGHDGLYETQSRNILPAVLHTSREPRAEALKAYSLVSGTRLGRAVYFNYASDVFFFHDATWAGIFEFPSAYFPKLVQEIKGFPSRVQYVIVRYVDGVAKTLRDLKCYRNLKRLVLPRWMDRGYLTPVQEDAVRALFHKLWNSEPETRANDRDLPPGIDEGRNSRRLWAGPEMRSWWNELSQRVSSGKMMEIPKDMTTEILFKTREEIEEIVGWDLGDNKISFGVSALEHMDSSFQGTAKHIDTCESSQK